MSQRIALIVNPTAGGGVGRVIGDQVRLLLRQAGHHIVDASGKTLADARERGARAVDEGVDLVVVVGGDGTAHLGVNLCAGGDPRLAVVAAGTGNDLARNLGLPVRDARAAVRVIETGTTRRVDAGRVTDAEGGRQWFGGVLGAGFDAVVTARAARMRWPRGRLRYAAAMVRELPVFRPIPYALDLDGIREETHAMLVAVANTTSFGGGMAVCPDADLADGLFDVLVVHALSIPDFVGVFPSVYSGRHVKHPAVEIRRAARVRLEAEGIESQADGEMMARLPVEVENVPGALELVVGSVRVA